jgi:ABC-2 type transport system ATP-binding protein
VAHRRIGEYSKGMQRRIGLAQALINDPDLLIVDEPTSGMDPIGTRQFKDLMRMLAQRGKSVILSSHLLADVEDVCDRVCVLYGGRQQAVGSVDELLSRQSLTQLTTDRLDDATLARVEEVVAAAGRSVREVAAPREKLESLFLRIVEDARQRRVATGGAVAGGQVAQFLRGTAEAAAPPAEPVGRRVIEQLVTAAETEGPPPAEAPGVTAPQAPEAEAAEPAREVLDDLVRPAEGGAEPAEAPRPGPAPARPAEPQEQVDRGVIDRLLRAGQDKGEGEERP